MDDNKPAPETLPGNHGQFGTDNATEDYEKLPPQPAAPDQAASAARG